MYKALSIPLFFMAFSGRAQNVGIGTPIPAAKLEVVGGVRISDSIYIGGPVRIMSGTPAANRVLTSDANGLAKWSYPNNSLLQYNYVQPNGSGLEIASTTYTRVGMFAYRGSAIDGPFSQFMALLYTTNVVGSYRIRLYDATNNTTIGVSNLSNTGTLASPEMVIISSLTNIPTTAAIFEIQLQTSSGAGRAGILSFQLYK